MASVTVSATSTNVASGTTVGAVSANVTAMTITVTIRASAGVISASANGSTLTLTMSNGEVVSASGAGAIVSGAYTNTFVYTPTVSSTASANLLISSVAGGTATFAVSGVAQALTITTLTSNQMDYGGSKTITVPCFLRGTMIATPGGERRVEDLRIGDLVSTLDGAAKPVRWIGRAFNEAGLLDNSEMRAFVAPVLIRAGALGDGLPVRELRVSPAHGLLVDGVLVTAAALVNGVSILRDQTPQDIEYFHIELDAHDVIISEGVPSETFVDCGSRAMFDNAAEFDALYGDEAPRPQLFARIEEGYTLAAVRNHLAALAGIETAAVAPGAMRSNLDRVQDGILSGWVMDEANPTAAVEVEVFANGESLGRALANRFRFDLEIAGLAEGRCAFTFALPASITHLDQIEVRRVADGLALHRETVTDAAI